MMHTSALMEPLGNYTCKSLIKLTQGECRLNRTLGEVSTNWVQVY